VWEKPEFYCQLDLSLGPDPNITDPNITDPNIKGKVMTTRWGKLDTQGQSKSKEAIVV